MKRAAFLYCADCDAVRFKVLTARGHLPFIDNDDTESQKWRAYSLSEALLLRLTLDFIGVDVKQEPILAGISPATAQKIVGNLGNFAEAALHKDATDLWIGQFILREDYPEDDGEPITFNSWFIGTLEELSQKQIEACKTEHPHKARIEVVRCNIANVGRAVRFVSERANDLGLSEAQVLGAAR